MNNDPINSAPLTPANPYTNYNQTPAPAPAPLPSLPPKKKNGAKILIICILAALVIGGGVIATLFMTGVFGDKQKWVSVGNYSFAINDEKWESSTAENSLTLAPKSGEKAILSIYAASDDNIKFSDLRKGDTIKKLINAYSGMRYVSHIEEEIDGIQCLTATTKYPSGTAGMEDERPIFALCEGYDGTIFLIGSVAENQETMRANYVEGVGIIKTAK